MCVIGTNLTTIPTIYALNNLRNLRNLRITSSNRPTTKATGPTEASVRKAELSVLDIDIHCLTG